MGKGAQPLDDLAVVQNFVLRDSSSERMKPHCIMSIRQLRISW